MLTRHNIIAAWICFLGGLFVLYQFLLQGSTSLMVPKLMHDLCLDLTQIGFLSSAFFYPYILLQIPSGILIDKFGPRKVLSVSAFLLAIGVIGFSFSEGFITANTLRIMMGISSAPGVACAMVLAARWFPQKFTIVAGIIEMMGMLGGAAGDYFLDLCIHCYGWRLAMLICGIVGLVLTLLILVFVRSPTSIQQSSNLSLHKQNKHTYKHFMQLLKNIEAWKHCLFGGFIFTIISAFASLWSIGFLEALYPNESKAGAFGTAFVFIGAALGAIVSGWLANKIQCKRVMQYFSLLTLIIFATLLYLPMPFLLAIVMLLLLGFGSGAYILPFASIEKLADSDAQGVALGFTNMVIIGLGGPFLQPLIGWLLNTDCSMNIVADFQIALTPIVIAIITACLLSFFVKK